jgi:hypothetical protein
VQRGAADAEVACGLGAVADADAAIGDGTDGVVGKRMRGIR